MRIAGTWHEGTAAGSDKLYAFVLLQGVHPTVVPYDESSLAELSDLVRDGRVVAVVHGTELNFHAESVVVYDGGGFRRESRDDLRRHHSG